MATVCHGTVMPGFEPVRAVFERQLESGVEQGASVALVREGQVLVHLWGGTRDRHRSLPWEPDTLACVFSTTKAVTALCVQRAIDQRLIDVDRPVRYWWPAFDRSDKREITLAQVLNHRAGLPAIAEPLPDEALFDWERIVKALVEQPPWWTPGTAHGYHMVTWGWLVGEVFRRCVGVSVGQYLKEEITDPHALGIHIGLNDEAQSRCADMLGPKQPPQGDRLYLYERVLADRAGLTARAMANPPSLMTRSNTSPWRAMELPSANGHASALGLAQLFDLAASGRSVISPRARERCQRVESDGPDPVVMTTTRFGPGFMLAQPGHAECGFGPSSSAFGHAGSGGSLAFADPAARWGFGYVMNQMNAYLFVDPRPRALLEAAYNALSN